MVINPQNSKGLGIWLIFYGTTHRFSLKRHPFAEFHGCCLPRSLRFQAYFRQKFRNPLSGHQLKRGLLHLLACRFAV